MKEKGINVIKDLKINENQYDFIYSDQTIEQGAFNIVKKVLPNLKKDDLLNNYADSFSKNQLIKNYIPKIITNFI